MAVVRECSWLSGLFRRFFSRRHIAAFTSVSLATRASGEHCLALELPWRKAVAGACSSSSLSFSSGSHSARNELQLERAKWQVGQGHRARGARSGVCCLTVLSSRAFPYPYTRVTSNNLGAKLQSGLHGEDADFVVSMNELIYWLMLILNYIPTLVVSRLFCSLVILSLALRLSHCVVQADLRLVSSCLPSPPECWQYRCTAHWVLYPCPVVHLVLSSPC